MPAEGKQRNLKATMMMQSSLLVINLPMTLTQNSDQLGLIFATVDGFYGGNQLSGILVSSGAV